MPTAQASHREFDEGVPLTNPSPAGHCALVCDRHADESLSDEYMPVGQLLHCALAVDVAARKPWPAPHAVTVTELHGDVDRPGLNAVPARHCSQLESAVVVPATNPMPSAQGELECVLHGSDPPVDVNLPDAHTLHWESAFAVPATNPDPGRHGVGECDVHVPLPTAAENLPELHDSHSASTAAVPGFLPLPTGQATAVCATHVFRPPALKPLKHWVQRESELVVPATNALPAGQPLPVPVLDIDTGWQTSW